MKATLFVTVLSCAIASLPAQAATSRIPNPSAVSSSVSSQSGTTIDLNTADVKTLSKSVKGIGKKRAEAIIKYRQEHGKFKSVNELSEVPGLGEKFVLSHMSKLQEVFSIS